MCNHQNYHVIDTRCFTRPVSATDENPRAHGNITVTDECDSCGARRERNVNQHHEELGEWGLSREGRRKLAELACREVPAPPPTLVVLTTRGRMEVYSDEDGMLCVQSNGDMNDALLKAAIAEVPEDYLVRCIARRRAISRWRDLLSDVWILALARIIGHGIRCSPVLTFTTFDRARVALHVPTRTDMSRHCRRQRGCSRDYRVGRHAR